MNMSLFMARVAALAIVSLPLPQLRRLGGTTFQYVTHIDPLYSVIGHTPLGDSMCHTVDGKTIQEVRLFDEALNIACVEKPEVPRLRIAAFTVIHECGHLAVGHSHADHDDPVWAKACRDMGINEVRYSQKGPDWGYNFEFLDHKLWHRIEAMAARLNA